jgi:hypothetical protein
MARLEEAKDVPAISVIDAPGIPEKKSFPPRLILIAVLTFLSFSVAASVILLREVWSRVSPDDPRKALAAEMVPVIRRRWRSLFSSQNGAA